MSLNAFYVYLVSVNLSALILMYVDKGRAKKGKWRIPELRLFTFAILLGSPGILIGMYAFHHKTKHIKFVIGIPLILIIQLIILYKILM